MRLQRRRSTAGQPPAPATLVVQGLVLGLFAYVVAGELGLRLPWQPSLSNPALHLAAGLLAAAGSAPWRRVAWTALTALAAVWMLIATTNLAPALLPRLIVNDGLQRADVIVVLSSSTHSQYLTQASQDRLVYGLRLWHAGWAPAVVCTGEPGNARNRFHLDGPAVARDLGLPASAIVPFESVGWRPMNTRSEALSIQAMAAHHGWQRVLLVTSPSHTRRSRAVFRQLGIEVSVVPAPTSRYEMVRRFDAGDRMGMMRDLLYESMGLIVYRLRGWV